MVGQGKGEIRYFVCFKMPVVRVGIDFKYTVSHFRGIQHMDDGIGSERPFVPFVNRCGQKLFGILQHTGGPNHHVFGNGNAHIKIIAVIVEFHQSAVIVMIPAINIIVHGDLRIPVAHKKGSGIVSAHAQMGFKWKCKMPGYVQV